MRDVVEADVAEILALARGGEAYETDFAYDDLYRRTSQTVIDKNNALDTKVTTWASDCLSAVCSTTDPLGNVTTSTFDSLGHVLSRTEPLHGSTTATTTWAYDENEKLVELVERRQADRPLKRGINADGPQEQQVRTQVWKEGWGFRGYREFLHQVLLGRSRGA